MPIKIIAAGAGSGKTYRITDELVQKLASGSAKPSGIIATTFTNAAAAELKDRVKQKLLESNKATLATEVAASMIGTVHSIGIRLIKRFAFEAGVSPEINILDANEESAFFNQSIANILTDESIEKLNFLSKILGFTKSGDADWRKDILTISNYIRQNNFDESTILYSKNESWESLKRLLPTPKMSLSNAKTQLEALLNNTIEAVQDINDVTNVTNECITYLKSILPDLQNDGFPWHQWVKISKLKPAKKSLELFEELKQFAVNHIEIIEFQENIRDYIFEIFDIAQSALHQYQHYKGIRGLVDYTDMEVHILNILKQPSVFNILKEELDLLVVDEFQDTSPLQLAIFLKLSLLANEAIWVGDIKQSIYGFRGAEPKLMQTIIENQGGIKSSDILSYSWRSRPDLVNMTNAIFLRAFQYLPPEQIVLEPKIEENPLLGDAIHYWHFTMENNPKKSNQNWYYRSLAAQIKKWFETEPMVKDKHTKKIRKANYNDIAILCRTNSTCTNVADALHHVGIQSAAMRFGILETKEIVLFLACLKLIFSKKDSLAVAELLLMAEDLTLKEIVENRLNFLTLHEENIWGNQYPIIEQLLELRPKCVDLSVREICEIVMNSINLRKIAAKWGNVEQRWANLDKFLSFAKKYEETCMNIYQSATLGGFLLWLEDLERKGLDEQSFISNENSVVISTYHKSKGLEWPIVISLNLDQESRENIYGASIASIDSNEKLDLDNVLGNRWIRFWINPYDNQINNTAYSTLIESSEEFAESTRLTAAEEARLLYVGLTRARDYQIFVGNKEPMSWLNRVFNYGESDAVVFDPNFPESPFFYNEKVIPVIFQNIVSPETIESQSIKIADFYYLGAKAGRAIFPNKQINIADWSKKVKINLIDSFSLFPPIENAKLLEDSIKTYLNVDVHKKSLDFKCQLLQDITVRNNLEIEQLDLKSLIHNLEAIDNFFYQKPVISDQKLFKINGEVEHQAFSYTIPRLVIDDYNWNLISYQFKADAIKNLLIHQKLAAAIIHQHQICSIKYWIIQPLQGIVETFQL